MGTVSGWKQRRTKHGHKSQILFCGIPILHRLPSLWCPLTHLSITKLTVSYQTCSEWFHLPLWKLAMGTVAGWSHPGPKSREVLWPTGRPCCFSRSSIKFLGHMGWKISDLNKVWIRLLGWSQLSNPSDLPCLFSCKMIKQNQLENHLVFSCHFCEAPFLLVKHTCDLDYLKLTQLLLLISLWGHWIQEIAKFNTHVKPLI